MSQGTLDLRWIARRIWLAVGAVAVWGLLGGIAVATLHPPVLTSTALVVLPAAVQSAGSATGPGAGAATTGGPDPYMAAQIVIAGSDPVLSGALSQVSPAVSLQALRAKINVTSPATGILSISAKGRTAAQAEATANAVAGSYTAYLDSGASLAGFVSAHVLERAGSATGTRPLKSLLVTGLIGVPAGALIGIIVSLAIGRRDLWFRQLLQS